jgi:hypothetical protein
VILHPESAARITDVPTAPFPRRRRVPSDADRVRRQRASRVDTA